MPARVKLILSLVWLCAAAGGYFFVAHLGQAAPSYAIVFLGLFATVAMWVFPEVGKKDTDAGNRR